MGSSNAVYIWDYSPPDGVSGWRHITSEAVFNKYAFPRAKIEIVGADFFPKSGYTRNF